MFFYTNGRVCDWQNCYRRILVVRVIQHHSLCTGCCLQCVLNATVYVAVAAYANCVLCVMCRFFVVIAVYIVVGLIYKRCVTQAKGLEQIPNYSFWRDFGNLEAVSVG
jgi:hypothetical protein